MGNADTHQKNRQRLPRNLRAKGVPEAEIERLVDAKRRQQLDARQGSPGERTEQPKAQSDRERALQAAARRAGVPVHDLEAHWDRQHAALRPDDRGYKPDLGDPLQRGAARVNTRTAIAARRPKATTRYELNRQEHA